MIAILIAGIGLAVSALLGGLLDIPRPADAEANEID